MDQNQLRFSRLLFAMVVAYQCLLLWTNIGISRYLWFSIFLILLLEYLKLFRIVD
jgi:hypothetical protein